MQASFFLLIGRHIPVVIVTYLVIACSHTEADKKRQEILHGTIAYPFVKATTPLGHDKAGKKFIIRSIKGDHEYAIEIPGEARDYDVEIPLAKLGATNTTNESPKNLSSPVATDSEFLKNLPSLKNSRPIDSAIVDGAFGVGDSEGPAQAPSYTLGISKINKYYKKRQYNYALIELNNLLAFYPNSAKLNKMKGTVLIKMHNYKIAELAWIKALELAPTDLTLNKALAKLQKLMTGMGMKTKALTSQSSTPIRNN